MCKNNLGFHDFDDNEDRIIVGPDALSPVASAPQKINLTSGQLTNNRALANPT